MAMKRQSLKLDDIDWQVLLGIAADCGCEYRGEPSWRRLIDAIASGNLSVVNRPDQRLRAFQEKLRHPIRKQQQKQSLAKFIARGERDRLRQEKIRRAAGIPPRGAEQELKPTMGTAAINLVVRSNPNNPFKSNG
jgi:hypothetical protein